MSKPAGINPNLIGLVSVLVWGASLPVSKILISQLGLLAVLGGLQAFCGLLGLIKRKYVTKIKLDKSIFKNPFLYGRWIFFVAHLSLIFTANSLVDKNNLSLVILLNYFWPTAIILLSVMFAGVKITRHLLFALGIILVLASLSIEILQFDAVSSKTFENRTDIIAYVLAFIGSLCWGLYSMLSKKAGDSTGGSTVVPFFQLTLGLVLPISFIPGMATWQNIDLSISFIFLGYGLLQFAAYLCWDHGMRKGNIVFLSLCADFMPWISLATAYLLLGTNIGLKTAFSGALLVAGAMITRYGTLARKTAPGPYNQSKIA